MTDHEPMKQRSNLLSDETFHRLIEAQRLIREETGFAPTLKLLINAAITEEAVNSSTMTLIKNIKQSTFLTT